MKKIILGLSLIFISGQTFATVAIYDTDSPVSVTRTSNYQRIAANVGNPVFDDLMKMDTRAPTSTGGIHYSGSIFGINSAASGNLKIPFGGGGGGGIVYGSMALTAAILKPNLAKAVAFLVRANPYLATALTLGWLAQAGIHYFSASDQYQQYPLPVTGYFLNDTYPGSCSLGGTPTPSACLARIQQSESTVISLAQYTAGSMYWYGKKSNGTWSNSSFITSEPGVPQSFGCPSGYSYSVGSCNPNVGTSPPVITPDQAANVLAGSPMTSSGDTDASKKGIVDDLIKNGVHPETESPVLTGPATVQGQASHTVQPDGTIIDQSTVYNNTYTNNYVDTNKTTTTTTTPPGGLPGTGTTTGPPDPPPADTKTDCDKYPDNIGCSKYGTVSTPDILTVVNVPLALNVGGYGSGSCPAPQTYTVHGQTYSMSNEYLCTLASSSKPLFIALAWLAAGFIVLSPVKG